MVIINSCQQYLSTINAIITWCLAAATAAAAAGFMVLTFGDCCCFFVWDANSCWGRVHIKRQFSHGRFWWHTHSTRYKMHCTRIQRTSDFFSRFDLTLVSAWQRSKTPWWWQHHNHVQSIIHRTRVVIAPSTTATLRLWNFTVTWIHLFVCAYSSFEHVRAARQADTQCC